MRTLIGQWRHMRCTCTRGYLLVMVVKPYIIGSLYWIIRDSSRLYSFDSLPINIILLAHVSLSTGGLWECCTCFNISAQAFSNGILILITVTQWVYGISLITCRLEEISYNVQFYWVPFSRSVFVLFMIKGYQCRINTVIILCVQSWTNSQTIGKCISIITLYMIL